MPSISQDCPELKASKEATISPWSLKVFNKLKYCLVDVHLFIYLFISHNKTY
jgi:hypothetical protein